MNTFASLVAFSFILCVLASCSLLSADRRAMLPTKVSFAADIARALDSSTTRPIKLTETQAAEVCRALRGSLQTDFCNDQMEPEMLASWWKVQTNAIAIVRWRKDHRGYFSVGFDQQGVLLFDSLGLNPNIDSPWQISLEPLEILAKTNSTNALILEFSITNKSSQDLFVEGYGIPWGPKPYQLEASRILQPGNRLLGLTPRLTLSHPSAFPLRIHAGSEETGPVYLNEFFEEFTEIHATNDILVRWRVKLVNGDARKDVSGTNIVLHSK